MMRLATCLAVCTLLAAAGCKQPDGAGGLTDAARTRTETKDARELLAIKPAPPPDINAATRLSAGRMFEAEGNLPAAAEQYRLAIAGDPNNIEAYTRLGVACNRMQRFEEATTAFMRAIELAPDKAYLHNNLGFCFVLQERFDDAERCFRNAIALRPDYQRARMNLGTVLAHNGRTDEAVAEFEKAVPRDAAFYNLGLILASNRKFDAAERAFRDSLALNPDSRDAATQIERLAQLRTASESSRAASAGSPGDAAGMALSAAPSPPPPPVERAESGADIIPPAAGRP
jgi:protein O-GlcNAc transferase